MCTNHKSREAVAGTKCCATCISWRNQRREGYRFFGLCVSCGKSPEAGFKICEDCRNRGTSSRRKREAAGLCSCGAPRQNARKKCSGCLLREKTRVNARRAAGLCYCGKRAVKQNYAQCQDCLDRKNFQNKRLKDNNRCQCGREAVDGFSLCPVCRKKAIDVFNFKSKNDVEFAILVRLRDNIYGAISRRRKYHKSSRTEILLGCSFEAARKHIESQFLSGMSWGNMGEWHIDHYIPCAAFDLKDNRQQRLCSNWRNLRPLWAADNLSKKDKLPHDYKERLAELEENVK